MYIVRFVNLEACKKIFPPKTDCGTFVLRSPEYYRAIESNKCDESEGSVKHKNEKGQNCISEGHNYLISCWTILDKEEPTPEEWKIFKENHLALISTPEKVEDCLKKHLI